MHRSRLPAAALLLFTFASCGRHGDPDDLSSARRHLHPPPCGDTPAVSGVAGVHGDPRRIFLGDRLLMSVCHLDQLVASADAVQSSLTLFIEGIDTGTPPVALDLQSGTVAFLLERNEKNRGMWRPFLSDPLFDREVSLHVSAGIRGQQALPRARGADLTIRLQKMDFGWKTWIWIALLILFSIFVFAAVRYTDLLRQGPSRNGVRPPYSLGRSQMAWWLFLVAVGYSFLWLVTGDRDGIPKSLLTLMGISSALALTDGLLLSQDGDAAPRPTKGWWRDVVTGEKGLLAFDRLQIVVWTAFLSGIFLSSVLQELTLPDFGGTLLTLMGISAGTYIGFQLHRPAPRTRRQ